MTEKNKSIGNFPNLRFPGFEERWELKKLKEVASKINSGKTPLGGEAIYTVSGVVFIRSQNVNHDRLVLDNPVFIPDEINRGMKNSVVYPNDILLNITGASLGRSCVVPENFTIGNVNQHVCVIRSNNKYNPRFIQPILSSTKGQDIFKSLQTGSGREGLNFESIKNIKIFYPSLTEQNKIANFLSLLDDRMQTQKKIISHLQTSIQSYRQKIFSRKIRFKDIGSKDYTDWEIKKLGEIALRLITKNKDNNQNVLTISAQYGLISQLEFFNKSVSAKNITGYYVLNKDDFAYNKSYSNGYPMGAIKKLTKYEKGVVSTLYICFKFHSHINSEFMKQYFDAGFQNNEIEKIAQEGARNHGLLNISISDFFNIEISLPSNNYEQTKIANFLSSIEEKIETERKILAQYENQKKYLLANLFA